MLNSGAAQLVARADFQFRQFAQHVEEHDGQFGGTANSRGVAGGHGIKPAASARTARDRAIFAAGAADLFADAAWAIVKLRWEWSAADASSVCLQNANDTIEVPGGYTAAAPDARRRAVGAGNEGISAVVHVEQAALCR